MKLIVDSKQSTKFIYDFVPKLIATQAKLELVNNVRMQVEFRRRFNVDPFDVLNQIDTDSFIEKTSSGYKIGVRKNAIESETGESLDKLIGFLEDGDLTTRGTHLMSNALSFLQNNWTSMNRLFLLKGGDA